MTSLLIQACEEAQQAFEQMAANHPLRTVLKNAQHTHGKRHGYVRELRQRLIHALDHHPLWQHYQNTWLAAKEAGEKPALLGKRSKRKQPHPKKGKD